MHNNSIAILGMGCVYPGAHSPEELWENILAGRRYFRISPDERLPNKYYFDPDPDVLGKTYCNRMAVISDWRFDPTEWKIPPITFNESEIVHWLALHTAREAINNSGIDFEKTDRRRVGVILGNSGIGEFHRSYLLRNRWPFVERAVRRAVENNYPGKQADTLVEAIRHFYESPFPELREDHLSGNMANVIAGRIANYYDFRSASYTVDGACASSLLAVINACNHLTLSDMDIVLAGGVDVSLDPLEMIGFAKTQALAKEDIRPYDERAEGMQTGEGCGIVVLAKEEYARQHGYHIHAVIKGWGVSSDGSGGITQPKIEGQKYALEKAYEKAGYEISTVGYVEGHGTGTAVGDKVEITALKEMLDRSHGNGTVCRIGSIKVNIGHTKAAAGVAGLIKAVMSLDRKVLPPHVNWYNPNPAFGRPLSNLIPSRGEAWESKGPRRASVSAFGFGGANTHITLEEVNADVLPREEDLALIATRQISEVIFLSARNAHDLTSRAKKLIPAAGRMSQADLIDLSAALSKEGHEGQSRVALVASTPWQLAEQLKIIASKLAEGLTLEEIADPARDIFAGKTQEGAGIAALFPGQGSQRLNMGIHWSRRYPFVREMFDEFDSMARKITGRGFKSKIFRDVLTADEETRKNWEAELRDTQFQQPSIIACSLAALEVLKYFGLVPHYAIGHSLGEISALVAGGGLKPADALQIAVLRARVMSNTAGKVTGGMAAVGKPAEDVADIIKKHGISLTISNFNSPRQTVVSGSIEDIKELNAVCSRESIWSRQLPVSQAFHSEYVTAAAGEFIDVLKDFHTSELSGAKVYSTVTGCDLDRTADLKELLARQITRPVRFIDAIQNIAKDKPAMWVEVGPGSVLSNLTNEILNDNTEFYPTDLAVDDDFLPLNRVFAKAFVLGLPLRTERLFDFRFHRKLDPYNYHPVLIMNPCERPVKPLEHPWKVEGTSIPGAILPREASEPYFDDYIRQRGGFLKEYIGLDYRNWPGTIPASVAGENSETATESNTETDTGPVKIGKDSENDSDQSMIDIVIDWIAKRTGYPREFISPDKKLRDDLNLDSIKAGELALMLSKKMGRELPFDLGIVANATIQYLVDAVAGFEGQRIDTDDATVSSWIKMFGVELLPAPLEMEERVDLPAKGIMYVVGEKDCQRTRAIADRLTGNGTDIRMLTVEQALTEDLGEEVAGIAVVLPEEKEPFFNVSPSQFKKRVEGLAEDLFLLMRKVLNDSVVGREEFHCLIVRPTGKDDPGSDIDGAAGFFKTLSLEFNKSGFNWKWITVPGNWDPSKIAELALTELQHLGERIEYHYSSEGIRLSPTAVQIAASDKKAPRLGGIDTVLVSGGGKGITFEMAYELAQKMGVKLGLLGSSPLPSGNDEESELAINLNRLKGKGIRHLYIQADVTNRGAVMDAVKQIERNLGRITAVLHGAGISRFAEFSSMDREEYLRCIRVKAAGLYNLLSAVPPKRLKALHVISSVLGRTGMFRQADYTFANAWLDGAAKSVLNRFPKLHGFSVGYSVWEGIGIGAKSGSLKMLQTVGVTPVPMQHGIDSYIDLATGKHTYKTFVCTGRLNIDVEKRLMPTIRPPRWRFLEKVLRFVPGVDLVAEAELTHDRDRYIPEHVFSGTPLMPTVLGLEGMVQAAMACIGTGEVPVIRDIRLKRPMIIPEDSGLKIRTLALAEPAIDGVTTVNVSMRSDSDGFQGNHFEVCCIFGLPLPGNEELPECPSLPEKPYPKGPEDFAPAPLFQGKFFRRITKIFKIKDGNGTLTEITVPVNAKYYSSEFDQDTKTPSPAIRDAMLQSAALMMPPGYLPESIEEVRFLRRVKNGEKLICLTRAVKNEDNAFKADITIFDDNGNVVEWLKGVTVKATSTKISLEDNRRTKVIDIDMLPESLKGIINGSKIEVSIIHHNQLSDNNALQLMPREERELLLKNVSTPRQSSVLANTFVAKTAAVQCAEHCLRTSIAPSQVDIMHKTDGKPELVLKGVDSEISDIDVSLSDSNGTSAAVIGYRPVGIDIETVKVRDAETWKGLLGDDGYNLALKLQVETGESFDVSATRVWTLIESGKKADNLRRVIPRFEKFIDDTWIVFQRPDSTPERMLSAVFSNGNKEIAVSLIANGFVFKQKSNNG